jgi:UDP-glucose:(heptosyl)LPS alpha-1,3-glucosyltransferase
MKVVQVVQEFSRKGGMESVAYELQQAWNDLGLPAQVVAGTAPACEARADITVLRAPFRDLSTRGSRFAKYVGRLTVVPAFTLAATYYLRKHHKNDVILSHGDTLFGDAVVIHAVNKASLQAKRSAGSYRWLVNPMHWWVGVRDNLMIRGLRYKRYIAISTRIAAELQALYKVPANRIVTIPNGVNINRFSPEGGGRARIRLELGIPRKAPVLLFVAHEFERKGLRFVLEALAKLPADYHLIVAGADSPDQYLNLTVPWSRVFFLGARKDIPELNRAADLFVFPTLYEAFGLVAIEAMASGTPVIATRVGGIEDYLQDGYNGYFVERNGGSIAAAILQAFESETHLETLGLNARKTALDYTWHEIAKQYYNVLTSLKAGRQ